MPNDIFLFALFKGKHFFLYIFTEWKACRHLSIAEQKNKAFLTCPKTFLSFHKLKYLVTQVEVIIYILYKKKYFFHQVICFYKKINN